VSRGQEDSSWTFLTNHAQVLLGIAQNPDIRLRDLAGRVGITERATQRIVVDLVEAGYVKRLRKGRRNHYVINPRV
jgi:DNA-binding MarR family transcriptional regulator